MDTSLEQLKDIHLPEAVSLWPLAPGWWILLGILILIIAIITWRIVSRLNKLRAKWFALRKLKQLEQAYHQQSDKVYIAQQLSILLHRVALAFYPRKKVAGLTGTAWLNFLDQDNPDKPFMSQGQSLMTAPYRKEVVDDLKPLFAMSQTWIKQRR